MWIKAGDRVRVHTPAMAEKDLPPKLGLVQRFVNPAGIASADIQFDDGTHAAIAIGHLKRLDPPPAD